jgi:hypothetical protein
MIVCEKLKDRMKFYNNSNKSYVCFFGKTEFNCLKDFRRWCEQNGMNSEEIWFFERLAL